jgi:hypothetical protein
VPNKTTRKYTANDLNLSDQFYASILNKTKTSTIRLGFVFFVNEILPLKFEKKPDVIIKIKHIDYDRCLKDLKEEDAITDGFNNLSELKNALLNFYPDIDENSEFTIVHFEID